MKVKRILEGCLNRDKKSWDIFVQKYSRLIYWAIRKRLVASNFKFNQDNIDCIFQEVFVSILNGGKLSQIKDIKTIASWLAVIASNKTVDFMRRRIKEDKRLVIEMSVLKDDKSEQELYKRDLLNLLGNIIDTLPAKEKIVIFLNLIEGRTHKEIAEITVMPVNTVSTIIVRAKVKVKKELEKMGLKDL
ncbi:MAG: sigma-70 family RNA polymerase sigma factor [Candidatus Omnitrophica bacterium]|nr:sigma-70 family RNA polymerase sigma factor [Candidatus Omnitrophota bacterium]